MIKKDEDEYFNEDYQIACDKIYYDEIDQYMQMYYQEGDCRIPFTF